MLCSKMPKKTLCGSSKNKCSGRIMLIYLEETPDSEKLINTVPDKNGLCYFPYWESDFICSDGFYAGVFLLFGDYRLKYRRWPDVLLGLLTFIVPYDVTGCWLEKPVGIKVYQRAEKDFPDYTQEVLYYREQKSVAEFRYSTPISRLQVWIDGVNVTERDLAECVDQTVKWANCL